jgi:hypothetical protein
MAKITIDGKEYDSEQLPGDVVNAVVAKNEIVQNRIRHIIEIEKIDVLSNYYDQKVKELMAKFEEENKPKEESKEDPFKGTAIEGKD